MYGGELIAGGTFQLTAAGDTAACIARWDGTAWQPFAGGMQGGLGTGTANCAPPWVYAMTVWNGDLIVGGSFEQAGGVPAMRVARWDGTQWHAMGSQWDTGRGGAVWALAVTTDNELIAGGWLQDRSPNPLNKWQIARWNGTDWEQFGEDLTWISTPSVYTLFPWGDDLAIGGAFTGHAGWRHDELRHDHALQCDGKRTCAGCTLGAGPARRRAESLLRLDDARVHGSCGRFERRSRHRGSRRAQGSDVAPGCCLAGAPPRAVGRARRSGRSSAAGGVLRAPAAGRSGLDVAARAAALSRSAGPGAAARR